MRPAYLGAPLPRETALDLLKIIRSFEEFLFEGLSWLFFYPSTLWRIVRGPLAAMDYSDQEISQPEDQRYDDALSPPLLLMITLLLANTLGYLAHTPPPPSSAPLILAIYGSQQNLLIFRCLLFSLTPLVTALILLRRRNQRVSRETLRAPFYAQCYLAAPFALAVSVGGAIGQQRGLTATLVGTAIALAATVWMLAVQTRWFARELKIGRARALATATGAFLLALLGLLAIVIPLVFL